ncbi:sigma-54 dependent transcriptional regulator [Gilvimarinus agarilyticus]|uniref:sigma-54-dependent transcriptional regulator n=1 Tax=unclassified Gilvimarinus TaxID=2642066 RepID=UPI001C08A26F|nr:MULTISPECIES: sigma-54 dependent transcriptional regulator [unclassified Gilvimarinus]MBU2887240.1 sigma-54 dependent transcriptional regulator [Gilvimarinus agarilyticus]MDO6571899.1 sigma-54 dependent transcriptional regulator [Gilvimarinus sp. 2_MG-2023]MDO6745968.1 sigma-54 dependent transcriptional regulator [Gilvimarinus sp. 1_MG-2023]
MNDTAVIAPLDVTGAKVLVTEDDPSLREALVDTLELAGYEVLEADCAEQALIRLKTVADIRLIVSDVNMGKLSGYDLLRNVKTDYPHIPFLLITAYASISDSVMAIKEGAVDYLVKPFEPDALLNIVAKHVGQGGGCDDDEPVAQSEASQQLLQLAERVAQSESTVLIIGESGTGKEVLARYIHNHSPRAAKPFVAINCAAIPENMLEATLFGHEKGAYTGAHASAPGKFEQANGGTLLLDEISEMDIGLQAKLLRVLQEREVERLGGRKTIKLNVRVIATSNRDMREAVMAGQFREDLYYRLSILPLQWAPLRDRPEDIVPLAEKLLQRHALKQNRRAITLDKFAKAALLDYRWPGNVRELDNIMQRALILQPGRVITDSDLGLIDTTCYSAKPSLLNGHAAAPAREAAASATAENESDLRENIGSDSTGAVLGSDLKQREFEIIRQTLITERGSRKKTAETLGISPRTLRYKIARLKEEGLTLDI